MKHDIELRRRTDDHQLGDRAADDRHDQRGAAAIALIGLAVLMGTGCGDVNRAIDRSEVSSERRQNAAEGESPQPVSFREVDSVVISGFTYRHGGEAGLATLLEIVGGGVTCFDYDLDGENDLAFAGGGRIDPVERSIRGERSLLCRGEGGFRFEDVTDAAGLGVKSLYSHGFAPADWNHDGFVDLAMYGYGGIRLYRNQGDGTFVDATEESDLPPLPWVTAAGWGDLNGDGDLDLYLGSYADWDLDRHRVCSGPDGKSDVCSPNAFGAATSELLIARGDGTFEIGSELIASGRVGKSLGVLIGRLEDGGLPSVYVTNDMLPNALLRQGQDGLYRDVAITAGAAVDASGNANASMGVTAFDGSGSGRFDLLVTNFDHEQIAFYRNEANGSFRHASREVGLNRIAAAVVGFGVVAADFAGTGWEDVLLTSGHVRYFPDRGEIRQHPILLRNRGGRGFRQELPACDYFARKSCGRGLAIADFDHDGDQDVVITHLFDPPVVLENLSESSRSWLGVSLVGTRSPRSPIGAIVRLRVGDRVLSRQLFGGGSFLSHSDAEILFRWPSAGERLVALEIDWPSGLKQRFTEISPGRSLRVVEPLEEPPRPEPLTAAKH